MHFFDQKYLELPPGMDQISTKKQPAPPRIAPKPKPAPKPKAYPRAKVIYDYTKTDVDEISLKEGDIVEVLTLYMNHII